jgi:hypothetical protein
LDNLTISCTQKIRELRRVAGDFFQWSDLLWCSLNLIAPSTPPRQHKSQFKLRSKQKRILHASSDASSDATSGATSGAKPITKPSNHIQSTRPITSVYPIEPTNETETQAPSLDNNDDSSRINTTSLSSELGALGVLALVPITLVGVNWRLWRKRRNKTTTSTAATRSNQRSDPPAGSSRGDTGRHSRRIIESDHRKIIMAIIMIIAARVGQVY